MIKYEKKLIYIFNYYNSIHQRFLLIEISNPNVVNSSFKYVRSMLRPIHQTGTKTDCLPGKYVRLFRMPDMLQDLSHDRRCYIIQVHAVQYRVHHSLP